MSGATTCVWAVPAGGTLLSGQGTTNVLVAYGCNSASGNVTVIPANGNGCTGLGSGVPVLVTSSAVGAAGAITGATTVNVSVAAGGVFPLISGLAAFAAVLPPGTNALLEVGKIAYPAKSYAASTNSVSPKAQAMIGG